VAQYVVRNLLTKALLWSAPLTFLGLFFIWPITKILGLGLVANWIQVFADQEIQSAIWFTLWQALVSTAVCLVVGIPVAYVLYKRRFAVASFFKALLTVPLVLPTIVVAIIFASFQKAHVINSIFGMSFIEGNPVYWIIVAHVFVNLSIVVRTVGSFWASLDPAIEEAAELAGAGRLRSFWFVAAPMLRPAIVSASALTFLYCFTSFGIVLLLGGGQVNSIETEISVAATQFLDLQTAAALALLQTAVTVVAFAFNDRFSGLGFALEQSDPATTPKPLDKRDRPALILTWAVVAMLVAIPILLLITRAFEIEGSFGLDNFINLATRGDRDLLNISVWQAASNSLRNLGLATAVSVSLGTLVSYLASRTSSGRVSRTLNSILSSAFMLPMGISSVVLGFGYLVAFGAPPLDIRSNWIALPIVQALLAMPLVIRLVYPALMAIEREQIESAETAGATAGQIWRHIELGLISTSFKTAVAFAMIVSIGEFGAASLLVSGDQATLSTVLYQLISRPGSTNYGMAMAVAVLLVVLTAALVGAAGLKFKRNARIV
jgi:thiamine transport system permease protein